MPTGIVQFQETPNPHAIKCVVGAALPPGGSGAMRSYSSREAAELDPVARALFAIDGVKGVLVGEGWLTVRKAPDASWAALRPRIAQRLEEALRGS